MDDLLVSRYFVEDDPKIDTFTYKDKGWNFVDLQWYSRIYEYRWAVDAFNKFFGDRHPRNVIDIGTGNWHPFSFMLHSLTNSNNVIASDIFDVSEWQYKDVMPSEMTFFQGKAHDADFPMSDCICCVSIFEHIPPDEQEVAIQNFVDHINDGGCLIMTFDIPGYDYPTNRDRYMEILRENGMNVVVEDVEGNLVTSKDNPIAPQKHLDIDPPLNFFRLFASK